MTNSFRAGLKKNDDLQSPIQRGDSRLDHLRRSADLLESWSAGKRCGLTHETSQAWVQTLRSLCLISEDLLSNFGFRFVLLGKFQSDPIEARFGNYRQLSGGNFFISLRQLLDGEKKLRVINKMNDLKTILAANDADEPPASLKCMSNVKTVDIDWLANSLKSVDHYDVSNVSLDDKNIVFYVAGYIGRGIARQNRCESCKTLLTCRPIEIVTDSECSMADAAILTDLANRGGLAAPTDFLFIFCICVYLYFRQVTKVGIFDKFIAQQYHEEIFSSAVLQKFTDCDFSSKFVHALCSENHFLSCKIISKMFHCFIKNVMRKINHQHVEVEAPGVNKQKIRKLTSK